MYDLAITLYAWAVRLVSPFHRKAGLMVAGQRRTFFILNNKIDHGARYIWFHAASLGEFEQGRPLIEKIRRERPDYRIVLTFFSPSGYEVRKDYGGADVTCYLPFDSKRNARRFVDLVRPEIAIFVKYEFWKNYLCALKSARIPTYLISSIFRGDQIFFKPYGRGYKSVLGCFERFFVQDDESKRLLGGLGYDNVTVSGDTRFDRVRDVAAAKPNAGTLSVIEKFLSAGSGGQTAIDGFISYGCGERPFVLVAGSTWEEDERILLPYFNAHEGIKLILAPHELGGERISRLVEGLHRPYVLYSSVKAGKPFSSDCLIIDCFGLLSTLYGFGDASYVGGGFGDGIHNTLEAAAHGRPVIFGPCHGKFREASGLLLSGGGFSVSDAAEFGALMDTLISDTDMLFTSGCSAFDYVADNLGATQIIFDRIFIKP